MTLLEVDQVTHRYDAGSPRPVLRNIELSVGADEVVALVGESGCGKTTLGKIVSGLVEPSNGTIRFEGADIASLRGKKRRSWRRSVQMVHQDPYSSLNPGLTIGTALGAGLLRHGLATRRTLDTELLAILRQVGLDATPDFLRRYPHQLSGGQRQRVAIARAISLQPELIVADEVTSMLDVSMRVAILDLLLKFRRERQLGFVFISHDFGVVRYFTQGGRILVMFYGVVVEQGPTEQVIGDPRHPYTYLLLKAIPVPDPDLAWERRDVEVAERLQGEPSLRGCIFSNRCPFAEERCRDHVPPLVDLGNGQQAACFFPDRVRSLDEPVTQGGPHDAPGVRTAADEDGDCATRSVRPGPASRHVQG